MFRSTMYVTVCCGCSRWRTRIRFGAELEQRRVRIEIEKVSHVRLRGETRAESRERCPRSRAGGRIPRAPRDGRTTGDSRARTDTRDRCVARRRSHADACSASTSRCARPQSRDSSSRACTCSASDTVAVRCATHTAKTNGKPGPLLPALAEVVDVRIVRRARCSCRSRDRFASSSAASPMTSRASCGSSRKRAMSVSSASPAAYSGFALHTCSNRSSRERDARHRAARQQHAAPVSSLRRDAREEHHAAHRAVGGDAEVGKQEIARRVARVLDRGDRRSRRAAPLAISVIELARISAHDRRRRAATMPRSIAPYTGKQLM